MKCQFFILYTYLVPLFLSKKIKIKLVVSDIVCAMNLQEGSTAPHILNHQTHKLSINCLSPLKVVTEKELEGVNECAKLSLSNI